MKESNPHIESLIRKFNEGKTTNAEEKELFDFFSREDIPAHLLPEKEIFHYFSHGLIRELNQTKPILEVRRKSRIPKYLGIAASIAAAVIVFFFINPLGKPNNFNPYEGSYIMRNGKKIYDIEQIKREEAMIVEMSLAKRNGIREVVKASEQKEKEYHEILNR